MSHETTFAAAYSEFGADGDPTESWQPYVDATHQAFDEGAKVVILSGRYGTGKSSMFGELLARSVESYHQQELEDILEFPEGHDASVVCLDEASLVMHEGGALEAADFVVDGIVEGQRFVSIFPGGRKATRMQAVADFETALTKRYASHRNIGDVVETHMHPARVAQFCRQLGVAQKTIDLLNDVPALRVPRLFDTLIDRARVDSINWDDMDGRVTFAQTFTASYVLHTIEGFITPSAPESYESGLEVDVDYGYFARSPHALLQSHDLTTKASLALYELVGQTPPTPEQASKMWAHNPYDKD